MKIASAVLFATALAACNPAGRTAAPASEPSAGTRVALDQPFELGVGDRATVAGEEVNVRFEAVAGDSRCPSDVQCVWAGNAVVRAVLSQGRKAFGAELNTTLEPKSVDYLAYNVALVSLVPYPGGEGGSISPSQYRATFVVTRRAP